jgi:opacity protein-like surface antigen
MKVSAVERGLAIVLAIVLALCSPGEASAQAAGAPGTIEGYALAGGVSFTAAESFETILGSPSGQIRGGGARIGLGLGGAFFDIGAWRYGAEGERVLIANGSVFPLGIPVKVTVTPIEVSGGWQFRFRRVPKLLPYVAGGVTSMRYSETSDFATSQENADAFFNGYHVLGGAKYQITRRLGVAGEASWTTIPGAIGESGVSEAFDETDLGGTTFRIKITIGR